MTQDTSGQATPTGAADAPPIPRLEAATPDLARQNVKKLAELFPDCVTEGSEGDGPHIDLDLLRQALSDHLVEGPAERYRLDWPGKRQAMLLANTPSTKTLRPVREDSVDFDTTRNLFIEGDNLEALKILQETYLGKVKMIYIDPPYNTGKDFIYKDNFRRSAAEELEASGQADETGRLVANTEANGRFHSDWLSMMAPRLKLARSLLRDDGIVLLSIDEKEKSNARALLDLVFGEGNHSGEIIVKNSSKNDEAFIAIQHEYCLAYCKSKKENGGSWQEKKPGLEEIYKAFETFWKKYKGDRDLIHTAALEWFNGFPEANQISDSKHYSWMDERGVYFASDLSGPNDGQYVYDLPFHNTTKICKSPASGWRYPEAEMKDRVAKGLIHFGNTPETIPKNKTYLKNTEYQSVTSVKYYDGRAASGRLKDLFGEKVFTNPKDDNFLASVMKSIDLQDEFVIDLFGGSSTLAEAAMKCNVDNERKISCITLQISEELDELLTSAQGTAKKVLRNAKVLLKKIQKPENVAEIGKERIRRAGAKILADHPDQRGTLDVGFRVLKVDSSNFHNTRLTTAQAETVATDEAARADLLDALTSHIKDDRTDEDLLFGALLAWGVDITLPLRRTTVAERDVILVDPSEDSDEDAALIACFARDVDVDLAAALAALSPRRVVFRDDGFVDDATKENVASRFQQLAPDTSIRVL